MLVCIRSAAECFNCASCCYLSLVHVLHLMLDLYAPHYGTEFPSSPDLNIQVWSSSSEATHYTQAAKPRMNLATRQCKRRTRRRTASEDFRQDHRGRTGRQLPSETQHSLPSELPAALVSRLRRQCRCRARRCTGWLCDLLLSTFHPAGPCPHRRAARTLSAAGTRRDWLSKSIGLVLGGRRMKMQR